MRRRRTSNVWAQATLKSLIGLKHNLDWDQMILEFYTPGEPNSGWVHCSWVAENPRKQLLRAYREDGKTKYKPIIGNAVDLD